MINVDEFSADTFQNFGGLNELLILVQKNMGKTSGCFPKIGVPQNGWFIMENPMF